jgi:HK97 family phage major capsid protein
VKHVIAPCLLETKGVNEGTAGEGGYLVYSEMQNEINSVFAQSAQIAPLCRQIVAGEMANGVLVPNMAETVRSTLSGVGGSDVNAGVKWYSVDEGNSVTSSQPRFGQVEIKMHQMASLVYISDAMLQDVSNIQNIVSDQVGRSLAFYMDSEILTNPLSIATGVIGHASCTTVTTTSGSPSIQQLKNMYYSCDKPGDAVWVMSRDNAAAIEHISQSATVGAYPIFTRDVTQPQTALLFGRPIIVSDVVGATDTASSLLFGNFNKYGIVTKGNGLEPRADMSIHLAFNSLTNAYRFVVRWGGAPLVKSKVLLPSGRYIAPFVSRAN